MLHIITNSKSPSLKHYHRVIKTLKVIVMVCLDNIILLLIGHTSIPKNSQCQQLFKFIFMRGFLTLLSLGYCNSNSVKMHFALKCTVFVKKSPNCLKLSTFRLNMVENRKLENLTTLDQVIAFCGHCVQCGVCDHHIPLKKPIFKMLLSSWTETLSTEEL